MSPNEISDEIATNLCKRIKAIRLEKGFRQKAIVERSGIHKTNYSKIESGKRFPTLRTLFKIAIALEEPISSFFNDEEFHQFIKIHAKNH